jgi:hypothetical protein
MYLQSTSLLLIFQQIKCVCPVIATLWAWWLLENYTHLRLVRGFSEARKEAISYLYPSIATPLVFFGSLLWWRRFAGIAENGLLVNATIENFGAKGSGLQDVTLSYVVEGRTYKIKKSFSDVDVCDRNLGDVIRIVYDMRNPKRVIIHKEQRTSRDY